MRTDSTLTALFRYQAWADEAFLQALNMLEESEHPAERQLALRLMNHCRVVGEIFKAHLTGAVQPHQSTNTAETPTPQALRELLLPLDQWFLGFVATADSRLLDEPVSITFTDRDTGRMTRQELLLHVVTHGTYHRGEVGRVLKQIGADLPWDTFAVHLHQNDPGRRVPR